VRNLAELERDLRELGRELAFPPTPDLAAAVRARVAARALAPRRLALRRPLVVALAAIAVAVGIAFAVPPARSAILRVFGVGGVRVELVDKLPERPLTGSRVLGDRLSLEEAQRRVEFTIHLPTADGFDAPDSVYVSRAVPGGVVFLVYGDTDEPRALLTEFASGGFPYAEKSVVPGQSIYRRVQVNGTDAAWIAGAPHQFTFRNREGFIQQGSLRLATNTLIWERGGVTYRLEGQLSLRQALKIAESVG
jgi:hypothetical protein